MPTARGALTAAFIDKIRYGVGGERKKYNCEHSQGL